MFWDRITRLDFLDHILAEGHIDDISCGRVKAALNTTAQPVELILLELALLSEEDLAEQLSRFLGLERVDALGLQGAIDLEEHEARERFDASGIALLAFDDTSFVAATSMPFETDVVRALSFESGLQARLVICERSILTDFLAQLRAVHNQVEPLSSQDSELRLGDVEKLKDAARDAPTIKLLNRIISVAVDRKATDIHVEPHEDKLVVRYRIDGQLVSAETLPKASQAGLTTRIKILANLNIAETRLPQDGQLRTVLKGRSIDLRVSTVPVLFGESVALRVLDREQVPLELELLGFAASDVATIKRWTASPHGMIVVTGPTGSGKSTTLYAALKLLNRTNLKIFSIEDPVENRMPGINQIQIKPQIGLDFAACLRSILRQDPDVVMVGEMRDVETARIALRASMTGHFVLTTLHTNSAIGSVTRLRDMGMDNYLIAASLRGIISQRLVRRRCGECAQEHKYANGVSTRSGKQIQPCKVCGGTGFSGRLVAYELIDVDSVLRKAIGEGFHEHQLEAMVRESGTPSLLANAKSLVMRGLTNSQEVMGLTN